MGFLDFPKSYSIQNQTITKATYTFIPRPLIFKLQKEVSNFSNICMNWSMMVEASEILTWRRIF